MTYGTGCVGSPSVRGSHTRSSKSPSLSYAREAVKPRSRGAQSAHLLSSPIPGSPRPPMALEGRRWAGGGGGRPRGSRVPLPRPSGAPSSANRSGGGRSFKLKRRTTGRGRSRILEVGGEDRWAAPAGALTEEAGTDASSSLLPPLSVSSSSH
jgi:hypothetical protein